MRHQQEHAGGGGGQGPGPGDLRGQDSVDRGGRPGQSMQHQSQLDFATALSRAYLTLHSKRKYFKGISLQALTFDDNSFDVYTIAFGIRNVVKIEEALREARRVLRPGGRFLCLEFSKVTLPGLDVLYDVYSYQLIPPLGQVIAGDWDSYQYLVESIRQFPDQVSRYGHTRDAKLRKHFNYCQAQVKVANESLY